MDIGQEPIFVIKSELMRSRYFLYLAKNHWNNILTVVFQYFVIMHKSGPKSGSKSGPPFTVNNALRGIGNMYSRHMYWLPLFVKLLCNILSTFKFFAAAINSFIYANVILWNMPWTIFFGLQVKSRYLWGSILPLNLVQFYSKKIFNWSRLTKLESLHNQNYCHRTRHCVGCSGSCCPTSPDNKETNKQTAISISKAKN